MKAKLLKTTAFVLIFILLFSVVQAVLTPDHNQNQNVWYTINGFRNLEKDSVEVLYFGASHMFLGVSPMKLYEDTGICSYCLSTAAQPLVLSYALLKMALETQSPTVVILDPSTLFQKYTASDNWRFVLDNLPLGREKLDMARTYASLPESDGFWPVIFPILKYHDRWEELSRSDFVRRRVDQYYTAGEHIVSVVSPNSASQADMDTIAAGMQVRNSAVSRVYEDDRLRAVAVEGSLWDPEIPEEHVEYLRKMHQLCQQAGAELILTTIPVRTYPMLHVNAWTREKHDMTKDLAEELGIAYVDMVYDVDTGVDFATDTYDGGYHLNLAGAEKVTASLGKFLTENYDIAPDRNDVWDGMLEKYDLIRNLAYFQMESDLCAYLEKLAEYKDGHSILIAASEEYTAGLGEKEFALFDRLGLKLIQTGDFADSYLAVIQNGQVEHEEISSREISYETTLSHDAALKISSAGWYDKSEASIEIDGEEYALNSPGLNIVVYDEPTGIVLDSVSVNTREPDAPVAHAGWVYTYLLNYESVMCLDGTRQSA